MKYLNTFLLLIILGSIGVNFYFDYKRDAVYQSKLNSASTPPPVKDAEPSPFDKAPDNPLTAPIKPQLAANTTISFEHIYHDFGRVASGPLYTTSFKFTNTGKQNLYISAAMGSCGCTVPRWPKEAIKPGESGDIIVEFDSKGRVDEQLKTVTVTTNTDPNKNVLTIHTFLYLKK